MKPLYIIPARGGSKGIPHKNIKDLCGKPLISYSIEAAQKAKPGYILVSTDDPEIAAVARDCGVKIDYMRPADLATDNAGSYEVIIDGMNWADKQGIEYDCIVLLQPTSPMRNSTDIDDCLKIYTPDIDMVVSVSETSSNPYFSVFEADQDGYLRISKGDGLYTRRQDAPKAYEYNGAVYVMNPKTLRQMPIGKFQKRIPYIMPREKSIDLDTPLDWLVAETIMKQKQS